MCCQGTSSLNGFRSPCRLSPAVKARGTASAASDVDLIAEFDPARRLSLLDMVGLELHLSDPLGTRVDLSPVHTLKAPVRERAVSEAVLAF